MKILQSSAAEIEASQVKVTGEEQIRTRASPLSSREQQCLAVSNQRNKSHGAAAIPLHTALPRPRVWMTATASTLCKTFLQRFATSTSPAAALTAPSRQWAREFSSNSRGIPHPSAHPSSVRLPHHHALALGLHLGAQPVN